MRWRVLASALLLVTCACGGDHNTGDAAVADAPTDGAAGAVSIPWLADGTPPIAGPALVPCPDGWREVVSVDGLATCDPYGEGGALDCPSGQVHFPGEPACAAMGAPCPAGDFADGLPSDRRVVYVQPTATGGDGSSPTTPYGSVTEFAVGGLPMGTVIALAAGTHGDPVRLDRNVVLWGACAARTTLVATAPGPPDAVVTFTGLGGEARDLSIADSPRMGVSATSGMAVLDGVSITNVETTGLLAAGAVRLTVAGIAVAGTRANVADGGRGIGAHVSRGATATVSRASIDANRAFGVLVAEPASELTMRGSVVRETQPRQSDSLRGFGVTVQTGASAEVTAILVADNRASAIIADGADTTMTLTDIVARDTQSTPAGDGGLGVAAQAGATVNVRRVLLERNRQGGVVATERGAVVSMEDVVVRDVVGRQVDDTGGRGIGVQRGATTDVRRARLERTHEFGAYANDAGSALALSDVVFRDIRGQQSDGKLGRGLNIHGGATALVATALIEESRDVGVLVAGLGTTAELTDVVVRETRSRDSDGARGRAMNVQDGASVVATRALFERAHDVGVFAVHSNTTARLVDVVVRDTAPRECASTTCPEARSGHGAGAYDAAGLAIAGFVVEGSEICGVHLARDAQVDLADGDIRRQPIGACVQIEGYELERLVSGVRYSDNGTNLQVTTLPLPEAAGAEP